eukprot:c26472_g1_i1 orf=106-294(+)
MYCKDLVINLWQNGLLLQGFLCNGLGHVLHLSGAAFGSYLRVFTSFLSVFNVKPLSMTFWSR